MFTTPFNLADLDGSNGFTIPGIEEGDVSGRSVSSAGDINGDGIDDIIIGAPSAGETETYNGYSYSNQQGESYVVFGSSEGFAPTLDLASLDGNNGFVVSGVGQDGATSGYSVSGAGDVNGDGIDDIVIGAPTAYFDSNYGRTGGSYVVFGSNEGFAPTLDLASLDGDNGFVLRGIEVNDDTGYSVSDAGDFNGDGIDDLLIGSSISSGRFSITNDIEGESYVVFGSSNGFDVELDLASLDGSNGFLLRGADEGDYSGRSVSSAGDVNGDGIDDIIIGAPSAGEPIVINGTYYGSELKGESYVVFGSSEGFNAEFNLADINGSNGFVLRGIDEYDFSGVSVSGAGDINGDGISDVIVSAPSAVESYVVFGNSSGFDAQIDLANLDGNNGFTIRGIDERDFFGESVSSAGDVNSDGIDDIIIGASSVEESYVIFGSSDGFNAELDLASLDPSDGFVIVGVDRGEGTGASVSDAGDINGDGIDDIIIGAPYATEGEPERGYGRGYYLYGDSRFGYGRGESYVVFGMAGDVIDVREDDPIESNTGLELLLGDRGLESLDGSNGFVIRNPNAESNSYLGRSVSGAGDINGDGIEDLIVGAPYAGEIEYGTNYTFNNYSGESYVIFGSSNGFAAELNPENLDGSNGFVLIGDESDRSGNSVSSAGDVNGDGIDDIIIGAQRASDNKYDQGESYVVFGSSEGFNAKIDLTNLDGNNGFVLRGIDEDDNLGESVSSAGDVNGDGIDDIIIGASYAEANKYRQGESYVVFGSSDGFNAEIDLTNLDGSNGFIIRGIDEDDLLGESVSSAGDLNGDGIDDILVGAPGARDFAGESYVVFGSSDGFNAEIDLASLNGSNGFVLRGERLGDSVSSAGDINGDGIDDIIIDASGANYLVFGGNEGFDAELDLASLDGSDGFVIRGEQLSSSVSEAGDVNGDGIDDIIIGAAYAGEPLFRNGRYLFNDRQGESYVIFGSNEGFDAEIDLADLDDSDGFALRGIDRNDEFGDSVSGVGDVNGDGVDDIIVGAPYADVGGENTYSQGESYVIFGIASDTSESIAGTEENDVLTGTTEADTILGSDGNDTIRGNLGNDSIEGNNGFDLLFGDRGEDTLIGGRGGDTLKGGADNDLLEGNSGSDDLFGNNGNDVLVGGDGNDFLQGDKGRDTLDGGVGNDTLFGGGGSDFFVLSEDNDFITDYQDGVDKFLLADGLMFEDLSIVQNIDSTQIKLTETDEVFATLNSVTANFLDGDDFLNES